MGYTHYFEATRPLGDDERSSLVDVMRLILNATDVPLAGCDGTGEVEFSEGRVTLNGVGDDAHETFSFPVGMDFNFCKTAYKPYDKVVTAILIAANDVCDGAFNIRSDGGFEDWCQGLALACRALGRELSIPLDS